MLKKILWLEEFYTLVSWSDSNLNFFGHWTSIYSGVHLKIWSSLPPSLVCWDSSMHFHASTILDSSFVICECWILWWCEKTINEVGDLGREETTGLVGLCHWENYRKWVRIYVRYCRGQMLIYCIIVIEPYKRLNTFPLKNPSYQMVVPNYLINAWSLCYLTDVNLTVKIIIGPKWIDWGDRIPLFLK